MSRELTSEKRWRLRQKRKEWFIEQEFQKKHEKRKLKMIQEYERRRAQTLKLNNMEESTSTENSQREIIFIDNEHSEKLKNPRSEIKEKKLQQIKISLSKEKSPNDKDTLKSQTNKDIDFENITIPRRKEEGSRPIFERDEIRKKKWIKFNEQRIVWLQDNDKSEHQLQTNISESGENADVYDRNFDNEIVHGYRLHLNYSKSITYQDDGINNKNKSKSNRNESYSIQNNKGKDRNLDKKRNRDILDHDNATTSIIKKNSSYRSQYSSVKENNKEVRKQMIEKELNEFSNNTESNKYQDISSDDIKDQKDKIIKKDKLQDKNSHRKPTTSENVKERKMYSHETKLFRRNNYDRNYEFYHHIPHPLQFNMNCNSYYNYPRFMYKEFNYGPPQSRPYYNAMYNTLPFPPHINRWPYPPRFVRN